ncbi:MAG: pyridoxal-phosphate dependent enzyme, partial [Chloroflexi bacterium]
LSPDERARGVIAVSTGNHGQSVAYAARLFGVKARIVVPEGANPGKVAAMQAMGAEVIFHGAIYDDAQLHCEALVREHGYRYIHSGNEPLLIAGVATETLEMLEDEPALEVIIVPIGGGSGASGTEEEIMQAMVWLLERAHTLAEGAGAASLAAAYRLRNELQGKKVGIVCSGGNASLEQLKRVLAFAGG